MSANEFINILIYRGEDRSIKIRFRDHITQDPLNITGWQVFFIVKEKVYHPDTDAAININITNHLEPLNGLTNIMITHDMTEDLRGVFFYNMGFITNTDLVRIYASGQIEFIDR